MEGKPMNNFAVINEDGLVVNLVFADSKAIAESVTGLTCVENDELLGSIGLVYINGTFSEPAPEPIIDSGSYAPPTNLV
jgi:hypothetical protein